MGAITRNFANNILGTGQLDATDGVDGNVPAPNVNNESLDNITALPSSVGFGIKTVSSDPPSLNEGEIFFNSTDNVFKSLVNIEAWSSGGNLITGRQGVGGAGTQDAALAISGRTYPSPYVTNTEHYDGSGWTTGGAVSTSRLYAATSKNGSQTACFIAAGQNSSGSAIANTEEYDGSSWTAGGTANTARSNTIGFGTLTAGVMAGGGVGSYNATEEYNGSSWTSVNNIGTARYTHGGSGLETAGLIFGGASPGPSTIATTEEYDGTSWTAGGDMNTGRAYVTGFGTQTNSIANGGGYPSSSNTVKTEGYNGTTWSNKPDSANTRWATDSGFGTSGSQGGVSGALANGPLTNVSATEEFNISTTTFTGAAWASGGSMNTSRRYMAGLGTRPASLAAGGSTSSPGLNQTANSEEYDGTSWSEGNNLNTARVGLGGAGSQTSSVAAGGRTPGNVEEVSAEEYNGTSWTNISNISTGRRYVAGFGASETAAVVVGGTVGGAPGSGTKQSATEEWNGSSWTAGGSMNTAKTGTDGNSVGTETAGLYITGNTGVEEYNGTAWSEVNDLQRPAPGNGGGACGVQTSALFAGAAAYETNTEIYDGTSFKSTASLGTGRAYSGGSGASSATGTIFGGRNSPSSPRTTNVTEEFTGETTAVIAKTIQSS